MPTNSKEYQREYMRKHRDRINAKRREVYANDEDERKKVDARNRKYQESNKAEIRQKQKVYNEAHKEERKARDIARRDEIRNVENEYRRHRYANDPSFRILIACRTRIRKALEGVGVKSKPTMKLIGCSVEDLKVHLENQFVEGMSWDNYGEWHIDHQIPCASFDLSNPDEQTACFHYKNLQPLWAIDNLIKGAKVVD